MLILYDAFSTLADAVGHSLANPTCIQVFMPPLTVHWAKLKDDDPNLIRYWRARQVCILFYFRFFNVFKCLASVTIAMGSAFIPYTMSLHHAMPVFERQALLQQHHLPELYPYVITDINEACRPRGLLVFLPSSSQLFTTQTAFLTCMPAATITTMPPLSVEFRTLVAGVGANSSLAGIDFRWVYFLPVCLLVLYLSVLLPFLSLFLSFFTPRAAPADREIWFRQLPSVTLTWSCQSLVMGL